MNTTLTFRFTRPDPSTGSEDDIIRITPADNDTYNCSFTYGLAKQKSPVSATLSDSEVFRWVRTMIRLLEADIDPFVDVQVDHPLMPSVMLNARALGDNYHRILDVVEFFLDTTNSPVKKEEPMFRTHTFFYDLTEEDSCCGHA
jgi:hypothetical protein